MGKMGLPATASAETDFGGWFHKTNFLRRIISILMPALVYEPFCLCMGLPIRGTPVPLYTAQCPIVFGTLRRTNIESKAWNNIS